MKALLRRQDRPITPHLLARATLRSLIVTSSLEGAFAGSHTTDVFADCHTAQGQKVRGTLINARPPSLADEGNKYLA